MEQLQTPTIRITINKKSTTTEPPPLNGQQPKPPGMPSKKGKASSCNIGLKIDGDLSFDNLKVAEKFDLFILQFLKTCAEF